MKLLRLKINDPKGFRSLPAGFEHYFRTEWSLQEEAARPDEGFTPFVCAGPNGSWAPTIILSGRLTIVLAGGAESEAA
ncbi:hypothetical protein [Paraburkholderia youngii]|uniref:Uncharacterized protein n=1 Tax=Paraburkholderia youngii TaxID=2782701 RepID=A0A7Y6K464_9BURK|nr:hypothetical protein [Paraburkholderia youngii]NUY03539.1 hypothetical protein [Paraburkholderia youngii]